MNNLSSSLREEVKNTIAIIEKDDYVSSGLKQSKEPDSSFETYFNFDGNLYFVRFTHRKVHANGNIITEDKPKIKKVFKVITNEGTVLL